MQIESLYAPAISVIGDKTFVAGGNVLTEVPTGTTREDIDWIRQEVEVFRPVVREEKMGSKSSDKVYDVRVSTDGTASCTCYGFQYRRKCCHVTSLKEEMGLA